MLDTIIVQARPEFQGLFLDLTSNRFRFRVTGGGRRKVAQEIQQVFGICATAVQIAQYFYHPSRVAWVVEHHPTPGNFIDKGESEILDHTFWPCRDMFIALAGMEPANICRMLLASVTATALGYELEAKDNPPASFLDAVSLFEILSHDSPANYQERIRRVYAAVKDEYEILSGETLRREFRQTMRVTRMLLGHFRQDFQDLGDTMPWFNLLQIVEGREQRGAEWLSLQPALTPTDLATITQMVLGVDTVHLAEVPLPETSPFYLPAT